MIEKKPGPKIYLIHDPKREDREVLYRQELDSQGIESWELIHAIKDGPPVQNIARAHKECVRRALRDDLPECVIMEDDVKFVCPGAYNEFLRVSEFMRGEIATVGFDILIAGSYEYRPYREEAYPGEWNPVMNLKRFSGLFC